MSEAEKKWRTYDESLIGHRGTMTLLPEVCISHLSREAYKAALRREIEKRIDESIKDAKGKGIMCSQVDPYMSVELFLKLLDTVEP